MLHYGNYSFNESNYGKCITTIQNISVIHDSRCKTDREVIHVYIEEYQTVDSIEIIIRNSQFVVSLQAIMIKDDSNIIECKILILNKL